MDDNGEDSTRGSLVVKRGDRKPEIEIRELRSRIQRLEKTLKKDHASPWLGTEMTSLPRWHSGPRTCNCLKYGKTGYAFPERTSH